MELRPVSVTAPLVSVCVDSTDGLFPGAVEDESTSVEPASEMSPLEEVESLSPPEVAVACDVISEVVPARVP